MTDGEARARMTNRRCVLAAALCSGAVFSRCVLAAVRRRRCVRRRCRRCVLAAVASILDKIRQTGTHDRLVLNYSRV